MPWSKISQLRKPAVKFTAKAIPSLVPTKPLPARPVIVATTDGRGAALRPVKTTDQISQLGPGNPAWNKPVIVATMDGRGQLDKPISNPRAPTTSAPISRATQDLPTKWAFLGRRMPDRGAMGPTNGNRMNMPDGSPGGVSRFPAPTQAGIERSKLAKASTSIALTIMSAVKKHNNNQRLMDKLKIHIVKGDSALHHAKAGPLRIDPRDGKIIYKTGIGQATRERRVRGVFSQHLTTPKSNVDLQAEARKARGWIGVPNLNIKRDGVGDPEHNKLPIPSSIVRSASKQGISIGRQSDQESLPIRKAPAFGILTTGNDAGDRLQQFLFLGAAVFIGWLALKGKG